MRLDSESEICLPASSTDIERIVPKSEFITWFDMGMCKVNE